MQVFTIMNVRKTLILSKFILFLSVAILVTGFQVANAATRTWDGGGADNNWSTAANWSPDAVPTSADDVVFNSTSTKNATVDQTFTINSVSINSGYSGTITQLVTLNVTNAFTQSAGIFQGTAANANFGVLVLNTGATFNAPSGTLSVTSQTAYEVFNFNGGTFNANGGTFSVDGRSDLNYFRYQTPTFNNLIINKPLTILNSSIIVNGTLTLNNLLSNSQVSVNGDVAFANGYTSGSAVLNFGGTATRTATIAGTTIGNPITINNPNLTLTTSSTSGNVIWNQKITLQAGTFQQTAANYVFTASAGFNNPGFDVIGGTFQGSVGNAVFNTTIGISSGNLNGGTGDLGTNAAFCPAFPQANYFFQQSGGAFNGGSGNGRFCDLRRTGGSFTAPSGSLTILNYGDFTGGTFSANNGTLIIENTASINAPGFTLNNVTLSGANGHGITGTPKPIINGTFNLAEGQFSNGDVAVNGDLIYGASFTGGGGRLFFEGTTTRTINLPARNILLGMTLDNPNITVTTSGVSASSFTGDIEVKRGLLQQGAATLNIAPQQLRVSGGTFQGSSAALNSVSLLVSGGTFSGGSGLISGGFGAGINQSGGTFSTVGDVEITYFTLSGGTFNAPNGLMTVVADWTHATGGTFSGGTGTVKFTGYNTFNCQNTITIDVPATETFNNLVIANQFCNRRVITGTDTLIVNGDFRITYGTIQGGRIRPLGTTTIDATNNGYVGSSVVEYLAPNRNFVINNPASVVNMFPVEMNAPNSTLTSSGAGRMNFVGMTLTNGTVNQGAGIWDITNPGYAQSGGTFNGSAAELFISNGLGNPILTGGIFNSGNGKVTGGFRVAGGTMSFAGDLDASSFSLEGGVFNAPLGVMSIANGFSHTMGGTFNARTGTVQTSTAAGTFQAGFDVNNTESFNNLRFNGTNNNANHGIASGDTLIVNGTLTFAGRGVNGGSIVANGAISYTNFGGYQNATTIVKFQDTTPRTVTFTSDCTSYFQPTLVDNPNITINTGCDDGNAVLFWQSLDLRQGTVNAGNARSIFNADFNQSGGTFSGGNNAANPATSFGGNFSLSGGNFNPAPITYFYANYTHTAGGNFNYGTGTVNFIGFGNVFNATVDVNGAENFNNVIFSPPNSLYGKNIASGDTIVANGNLTITGGGYVGGGTLEAKRNFTISGGFLGGNSNVLFSGAADQTYTNTGNGSPSGTWTVNKPDTPLAENNFAPAASSTLYLNGNISNPLLGGQPFSPLNIVSGVVRQTGNFSHSLGSFTLAANTAFVNLFGGTMTLAGGVANDGRIILDANGNGCQNDDILLRSSVAGTQRGWNGAGIFRMIDVNVRDQAGAALITVFNGTDAGNNGMNFIFDGTCLPPTAAGISIAGRVSRANGTGISKVVVAMVDASGNKRYAMTGAFGYYRFDEVAAGQTVVITVSHKTEIFANPTLVLTVNDDLAGADFIAIEL